VITRDEFASLWAKMMTVGRRMNINKNLNNDFFTGNLQRIKMNR